ncbi:1473_t:CDS:2, partial [Cetraspora pellucida]
IYEAGALLSQCFEGHGLNAESFSLWWCDVCGKRFSSSESGYCEICDFNACLDHCKPGQRCKSKLCNNRHPLYYLPSPFTWTCN